MVIYVIQPLKPKYNIFRFIKNYFNYFNQQPSSPQISIRRTLFNIKQDTQNTYIIQPTNFSNDKKIIEHLRRKDRLGQIILIANDIDYNYYFSNHLRLLGAIDTNDISNNHDFKIAFEPYLDYIFK